jgi:hypothetical protein
LLLLLLLFPLTKGPCHHHLHCVLCPVSLSFFLVSVLLEEAADIWMVREAVEELLQIDCATLVRVHLFKHIVDHTVDCRHALRVCGRV